MADPISVALMAMVGAIWSGMANEAGKRAYEMLGGLATRIAGREVPAPSASADLDALVRLLRDGAEREPGYARSLAGMQHLVHATLNRPDARDGGAPVFPSGIRSFTDRQEALARLSREAFRKVDGRPRRAIVHGPEGIGSSALAVQWCRANAARFPDGLLYADLRGEGPGHGRDATVALRDLLTGLGLAPADIPPGHDQRARLFRRLTDDRKLCVVLDHAETAAQVEPLLSGGSGVFTIVVAHRLLPGVDAEPVPVGPLKRRDATQLLTHAVGKEAVAAARAVLPSVLERCAGRPYALLAAVPDLTAAPHGAPGTRPETGGDMSETDPVQAIAERAVARLAEGDARCYRLWALRPWPTLAPAAAAAIAEVSEQAAAALLARLAAQRLLEPAGAGRYRYRDGVRRHGEAEAVRQDGLAACARAVLRGVAYHLDFAVHADLAALPERWHLGPRYESAVLGRYANPGEAVAALKTELPNLVQAVRAADEFQDGDSVVQLAEALWAVQLKAGRHDELLPALRIAARVGQEQLPGTRMAGRMHTQFAFGLKELRQFTEAEAQLRLAANAVRVAGHTQGVATAVESLGLLRLDQWRWQEALDCFMEAASVLDGIGPGDEGHDQLPRARALLHRHRGRALRGLDRLAESLRESHTALAHFQSSGDRYNAARTLTDLAETHLKAADPGAALPLVDEALAVLESEQADHHVTHLRALRAQCTDAGTAEG